MKYIVLLSIFMFSTLFGARVTYQKWERGMTFSQYLSSNNIPKRLLGTISEDDKKFLAEMQSNYNYFELKDDKGVLLQALIPINKEMQIHLFKAHEGDVYGFDIIPIVYKEEEHYAKVVIERNPYSDTIDAVNKKQVAQRLGEALKGVVNPRRWKRGDELFFSYRQKTRLGMPYLMPNIQVIGLESRGKRQFIYVDEDGDGHKEGSKLSSYTQSGDYIHKVRIKNRSSRFGMPLRHVRITSKFSLRRWHPILKRYRPHHGTDFGARRGTPLLAVYSGKVTYAGWMGGYGKVVKIRHPRGYVSLYAHQSRIRVHRGEYVKKGQIIGYVGNTGRSTGPHLHFGLTRNGRWVNPMKVLKRESLSKKVKYRKIVIKDAKQKRARLVEFMERDKPTFHI